jgi:hypothetical protein
LTFYGNGVIVVRVKERSKDMEEGTVIVVDKTGGAHIAKSGEVVFVLTNEGLHQYSKDD